ncbi:hypothetical protein D3C87_1762860 [compost metagenome]
MFGYFSKTATRSASSSLLYTDPVGLHGEENMNNLVLGVIAASSCAPVILKLFSTVALMKTVSPSASLIISE